MRRRRRPRPPGVPARALVAVPLVATLTVPLAVPLAVLLGPAAAPVAAADGPRASLTLAETVGRDPEDRTLVITAVGPPPSGPSTLADTSGLHSVTVTPLPDGAECDRVRERRTGLGDDRWCLRVSGITTGQEYRGEITGPRSAVAVSLRARHGLWPYPFLTALAALAAGVLVTFCTTRYLPKLVTRGLLTLARRDDAGITGLSGWAAGTQGRLAPGDALARMRWAKRYGRQPVLAARAELRKAAARLPDCPLRTAGEREAGRSEVAAADLLTPGGARRTSDAERLLGLVGRAEEAATAFDAISARLLAQLPAGDVRRPAVASLIEERGHAAENYLSEFTVDRYVSDLADRLARIRARVHEPPPRALEGTAAPAVPPPAPAPAPVPAQTRTAGATALAAARFAAVGGAAVLAAGVLMITAVVSMLVAQYFPDATFGTAVDYAGLVVSAVGSSTAAGVLSVVLLMRGPQDWYG